MEQVDTSGTRAWARGSRPRLERSRSDRFVAGVAGGIAAHLGVSSTLVRLGFVGATFAAGFGVVVYILTWLLVPMEAASGDAVPAARRRIVLTPGQLIGLGAVIVGVAILFGAAGLWFGGDGGWPILVAAIGSAVLWARRGDDGRGRPDVPGVPGRLGSIVAGPISWPRVLIGAVLVIGGMGTFLAANTSVTATGNVLMGMLVAVGGVVLLAGPWAWSLGRQLVDERSSRARSEARAEMAAHLHDSVLQTLTLIQRAKSPAEMSTLARTQERELRAWLYGRAPTTEGAQLRDAIDAVASRVERQHDVRVETVVVGDLALDDRLRAVVDACGEAMSNAGSHSGADTISVYVEAEPEAVSAFVRDQGRGFDPAAVPPDRRGIADSIIGRIERHGGTVTVTSQPGAGTEVQIRMPLRVAPT